MKIIQFSVLRGAVTSPADLGGWIFTTLPPHSLPAVIVINELHYESTDTCLRLPFSSHIPHLFGLNYAVQSSFFFFFFFNNLPACCSASPGSAALDSISGPRQANLGQSCRRFLDAQGWMTAGLRARRRACPSVAACANHCVGVSASMTMYVSAQRPQPSCQRPDPIHISFIRAVLQQIVWRNSELIAWFYASSFKQGSHMALRTVKWAILWRGRRRCADRRADTPGVHRKWTFLTVSCCHCCHLPGGRTSNKPVR